LAAALAEVGLGFGGCVSLSADAMAEVLPPRMTEIAGEFAAVLFLPMS
jgi:hypothetical protein